MNRPFRFPGATVRRFLPAALLLLAAGAAACGDDEVVTPVFGSGCSAGELRVGQSRVGAFDEASPCVEARHFWTGDRSPYDAYAVHLEAGKAYLFRMEKRPDPRQDGLNEVDALLTIFGRDDAGVVMPLALSDDEGGARDAEIFFVAPRTGTYRLVAGLYGDQFDGNFGGYLLTSAACPVLGRITGSGREEFTLAASACVRTEAGNAATPATYRFVTIDAAPNQRVTVAIDADDFEPAWELFGPAHDVFQNLYDDSEYEYGVGNGSAYVDVGPAGGRVTLAIGRLDGEGDEFELTVTRSPVPTLLQAGARTLKTAPAKAR